MTVQDALTQSVQVLQQSVAQHQRLLTHAMEGGEERVEIDTRLILDCPHRRRLRETLAEAITVLEETRKAFKSKRLEALRNKLIGVLAEDA